MAIPLSKKGDFMKKMHLLCNAHIDPVWLWKRDEGLAEALSTFRVAAEFCETYDSFVFNHNEALLYQWVEEYEPDLFVRIRELVKKGNWKIMGGWYLQPDCVMTSGESLLEQIRLGREYFKEKFDVVPETAINFDPFGHTRGLVQILNKNGYKNYIFMRPEKLVGDFVWEGFDGSRVLTHGIWGFYNCHHGKVTPKITEYLAESDAEIGLLLWGIGNHGGGPSKLDLEHANTFINSADFEVLHSSADAYFEDISADGLEVVKTSLGPSMVGCYTSMVRIKQAHRRLENKIATAEKIMSYAEMQTGLSFEREELQKAKKALAFCQFHDILPGSAIRPVEEESLRTLAYGEEIADKLYSKAFFALCDGQKKAKDGEIPIMVFNPHPYEIEGEFEVSYALQIQNWNENETTLATVYDKNGNYLPTQDENHDSSFNVDWMHKISFRGKLAPSGITRFDCKLKVTNTEDLPKFRYHNDYFEAQNSLYKARISRKTGLIELYEAGGKTLIKDSGKLQVYKDNEDPWASTVSSFKELEGEFTLMSDEDANEFLGYPSENIRNVRVIEDGDVRTKVQAIFEYKRSIAVVEYTLPKHSAYIDVDILYLSNDVNKMVKFAIDTEFSGKPWGETAFGCEELYKDGAESVYHKWCGIKSDHSNLYVVNKGFYGGSFTENSIKLSLIRTPVYSTLPNDDRPLCPTDRYLKHIDMGERQFSFRITAEENIEREAMNFNEAPTLLSFFPSGKGEVKGSSVTVDNHDVILTSVRKTDEGYMLTLLNFTERENSAEIEILPLGKKLTVNFKKFEYKTVIV